MKKIEAVVKVGISDINFVQAPEKIRTSGLGSCVGIIMYDDLNQVAGLAHIMLPDSTQTTQKRINLAKYADTAIKLLIDGLLERQVLQSRLKAKIAGGAQMFAYHQTSAIMRIGPRNIEAVQTHLKQHQIPLIASDVGGNNGRTIEFDPITSKLKVRSVRGSEFYI